MEIPNATNASTHSPHPHHANPKQPTSDNIRRGAQLGGWWWPGGPGTLQADRCLSPAPRSGTAPQHGQHPPIRHNTSLSLSFCACVCVYNKQTQHILCWQSRSTLSTSDPHSRRNQTHLVNNYLDGISFFPCSPKKMHRVQQQVTVVLRVLSVYANRNCVYLHYQLRRKKKSIWKLNNALPTTSDGLLIDTSLTYLLWCYFISYTFKSWQ